MPSFPRRVLKSNTMRLACFLLLASCRGLIPKPISTSKIRTEDQNSQFNSQPKFAERVESALLSTNGVSEDIATIAEQANESKSNEAKPCFWKPKAPKSWWKERILLEDLKVGQELSGHVVQEYLDGKTGPKLYFECGVGKTDRDGNWSIVNGMLRLDRGKASVARKRAARFRKRESVQLFVSRIQKECGRLEVCAKIEDVRKYDAESKISVTKLKEKQEVIGKVFKLHPYGAIIDIGANVRGLLHITKVANVMNRYIDKEKGLKSAGLEKGAKVRLQIESLEKRRLSLDFTEDVKEEARQQLIEQNEPANEEQQSTEENKYSQEELDAWAEYAYEYSNQESPNEKPEVEEVDNDDGDEEEDDDYEDEYEYDQYDEEMDIESSLGLDMY